MKSPKIVRVLSSIFIVPRRVTVFKKIQKRNGYIHAHIRTFVCRNRWYLSCKCVCIGTQRTTPQHTRPQH